LTEAFIANQDGRVKVTVTGWIIFVITSGFLSFLVYMTFEFGNYILFVRRLTVKDFEFCLPPRVSVDISIAVRPCVYATYVLLTLFIILAIFVIRDFWQLGLEASRRIWLLAPYILACSVAFLPFFHLHRIMAAQKQEIIAANNRLIEQDIRLADAPRAKGGTDIQYLNIDHRKLLHSVDSIEKLQKFYQSIRVWPSDTTTLFLPNMSILVSVATLTFKVIDSVKPG
jgi:hypothetical protein